MMGAFARRLLTGLILALTPFGTAQAKGLQILRWEDYIAPSVLSRLEGSGFKLEIK